MLTNSRLLQIGMQPTVAIVFAMHFKRESYQGQLISVQSSMATLKIWFTICCFRRATQPGKTIPKGWYQRSAYFKEMGLLFLWVFFQKKTIPMMLISAWFFTTKFEWICSNLSALGMGHLSGPKCFSRVLSIPPGSIPKHWPRQVECSQYRSLWPFLRFTTLSAFIVI